jgi:hypothetical protein
MKLNTFRNQNQERDPEAMTYWRRRFVALATGLTALAVVAWAFSGILGASGVSDAAVGHPAAAHGRTGTSGAGRGNRGGSETGSDGSGTGPAAGSPGTTGNKGLNAVSGPAGSTGPAGQQGSAGKTGTSGRSGRAGPAGKARTMRACKPGDVVLSLFASRDRYRPGQTPQFDVDVVSTAARSCAFNVGLRFLNLAVRAQGRRIWDSSECASGRRSYLVKLVRGVPAILPVAWNLGRSSARGCAKAPHPALTGRFAASAMGAGLTSNTVKFLVH